MNITVLSIVLMLLVTSVLKGIFSAQAEEQPSRVHGVVVEPVLKPMEARPLKLVPIMPKPIPPLKVKIETMEGSKRIKEVEKLLREKKQLQDIGKQQTEQMMEQNLELQRLNLRESSSGGFGGGFGR